MACHSAAAEALPSSTLARRVARGVSSSCRVSRLGIRGYRSQTSLFSVSLSSPSRAGPREPASAPCQPSRVSVDRIRFSPFAGRGVPVGVARWRAARPQARGLYKIDRGAHNSIFVHPSGSRRVPTRSTPLAEPRAALGVGLHSCIRDARRAAARHGTTQGTAPRTSGAPARAQPGRMQRTTIATLCKCRTKLSAVPSSARLFSLTQPERRGSRTARASGRRSTPWQRGKRPCPAPLPFASPQPAPGRLHRGRSRPRPPCRPSP